MIKQLKGWFRYHVRRHWHTRFGHRCRNARSPGKRCTVAHPEGKGTVCCDCLDSFEKLGG